MCRFIAYHGHPVVIADLLYRPRHSLVSQSMRAELMSQSFNADGFGIGFYTEGEASPCVLRTCSPAWSNRGFERVAQRLTASRVFGHIRAASPGLPVQETNCHPFDHGRFQFMHNGTMANFSRFKRRLQNGLTDAAWERIEGSTDSEHAFALLIDQAGGPQADLSASGLKEALVGTLARLVELDSASGPPGGLICNFAVSDGRSTAICRFARRSDRPASLFYSAGSRYLLDGEDGDMLPSEDGPYGAVIVASEPITRRLEEWTELALNHTLAIDAGGGIRVERIRL